MFLSRMKVYHVNKYHSIYCTVLRLLGIRKELFYWTKNLQFVQYKRYKLRSFIKTEYYGPPVISLWFCLCTNAKDMTASSYTKKKSNFYFLLKIKTLLLFVCSWEKKFTWLGHYFTKSNLVCCIHILFWYVNILNY